MFEGMKNIKKGVCTCVFGYLIPAGVAYVLVDPSSWTSESLAIFSGYILAYGLAAILMRRLLKKKSGVVHIALLLLLGSIAAQATLELSPIHPLAVHLVFIAVLISLVMTLLWDSRNMRRLEKELMHTQRELGEIRAEVERLDNLKSEFISIASHQLRSPLTAMKGYASLILEGSFGETNRSIEEAVRKIYDSTKLMTVSVQDFLDVSRIEQGKMKYHMEAFDLGKLVHTVVEEQLANAQEKGLSLAISHDEGERYTVWGDLGKIKQVLTNIIDNAIKYTPKGTVSVCIREIDGKYDIQIADTGVGIPHETLPKLFDKFVRSRNAHKVNVTGTGLGLYVVREMIKAHGGAVWASSEGEGKGSVFHVELLKHTPE
jgi:signal transduction histidine kinase